MIIQNIPAGKNPPWDVNVLIEIPLGSEPVKYEFDPHSGGLFVDRFLHTPMYYPCNYGFIPQTLGGDGDPIDVLVVSPVRVVTGAIMRCRPIGMLKMVDEEGNDEKILAVPVNKLHPFYKDVTSYKDLPQILLDQIVHFFTHYKDLESDKWVKLEAWYDQNEAAKYIIEAIERVAKK